MQALTSVKRVIDKIMEVMCIAILAIMTILVVYQVITRKIFNSPSAYSEAISQYLFVWMILYGSAYVFGMKEHLDITVFKDKMKGKTLLVVEILTNICLVLFAGVVLMYGGYLISGQQMSTTDAALGIPMGVIYSAIPISGVFTLFYAVYNCFLAVDDYKKGNSGSQEAKSVV